MKVKRVDLITCPERSSLCRGHTAWLLAAPLDPLEVRALCSLGGEVATPPLDFFLAVILGSMNNEKMLTFSSSSEKFAVAEQFLAFCK